MNLAGNQAKQLFKSLRTGRSPSMVGFWAAATAVDQMRKRSGPKDSLIVSKTLKPGQSYIIRMPGADEGELAGSLAPGSLVEEVDASGEGSIASQLMSAATGLLGAATSPSSEPATPPKRGLRRRRHLVPEPVAEKPAPEKTPGRRARRRNARLASLEEGDVDRAALPRRRRRKLDRAERRAHRRPSRRRIRRARRQQRKAAGVVDAIASRSQARSAKASRAEARSAKVGNEEGAVKLSRRRARKIRAAEEEMAGRQSKVDKRSTRRRRRKLRKAEKRLTKLKG